jgi:hypothetical protein
LNGEVIEGQFAATDGEMVEQQDTVEVNAADLIAVFDETPDGPLGGA